MFLWKRKRLAYLQKEVRPAVEAILAEAEKAALSETEYATYEDVFGAEDEG
ncbi:MAG: hypothetical protein K2M91_04640 [Lachnospiraceae bacterium]|nr:hypothetical protein [Lachnospiraceae bacterium]